MIFLIIIKNISNSIIGEKVPNTVLGDASRLIPGHTTFASKKGLYGVWPGISVVAVGIDPL